MSLVSSKYKASIAFPGYECLIPQCFKVIMHVFLQTTPKFTGKSKITMMLLYYNKTYQSWKSGQTPGRCGFIRKNALYSILVINNQTTTR